MRGKMQSFIKLKMQSFGRMWSKTKGQKISSSSPHRYTCQYCKQDLPLTEEYFDRVKAFKTGYSTVCKECSKPKPRED